MIPGGGIKTAHASQPKQINYVVESLFWVRYYRPLFQSALTVSTLTEKDEKDEEERAQPSETSFFYELLFGSLRFDPLMTSSSSGLPLQRLEPPCRHPCGPKGTNNKGLRTVVGKT